jgi:thiol:disulfide interchange protein
MQQTVTEWETQPLELQTQTQHQSEEPTNPEASVLKPVDRGRDAWTVLIAGFIFEALFWGALLNLTPCAVP